MKKRMGFAGLLVKIIPVFMVIFGLVITTGCSGKNDTEKSENQIQQEDVKEGEESMVKKGDTIQVEYTGTLKDGTVFDKSVEGQPLEFTVGSGQIIPGFDKAVEGMKVNEEKNVTIKPEEAYGVRDETLKRKFPRSSLPADLNPEKGMQLTMTNQNGQQFLVTVFEVSDEEITVDLNHPLAGKELNFDIKVSGIK